MLQGEDMIRAWAVCALSCSVAGLAWGMADLCEQESTGAPVRVTGHQAPDVHPRWSPDGRVILFSSLRSGNIAPWTIDRSAEAPAW